MVYDHNFHCICSCYTRNLGHHFRLWLNPIHVFMLQALDQISLELSPLIYFNSVTFTITLFQFSNSSLSYSRTYHLPKPSNSDTHQNIPISGLIITTPAFPLRPQSLWPSITLYSVYHLHLSSNLISIKKIQPYIYFYQYPFRII